MIIMINSTRLLSNSTHASISRILISQSRCACGKAEKMVEAIKPPNASIQKTRSPQPSMKPHHPPKSGDAHKYCVEHVRRHDRENFLAALCIEDPILRRAVLAIRAFNVELSLIKDSTSSTDRAMIRFHFWSKFVEEIVRRDGEEVVTNDHKSTAYYKQTPVAKELLDLFHLVKMDDGMRKCLEDLIGARLSSKAMGTKLFESMEELELYCEKSNGSLYNLCIRLNEGLRPNLKTSEQTMQILYDTSKSIGIAQGLSNVIRGIPFNASRECCYIPMDLFKEYQLKTRDFIGKGLDGDKIKPVVEFLSKKCQDSLNIVNVNQRKLLPQYRQLFMPRVGIQLSLNRLRKLNYNICDSKLQSKSNIRLPLNLLLTSKIPWAPVI